MLAIFAQWVVRRRVPIVLAILVLSAGLASRIGTLRIVIDPATALPQSHPYVVGTNLVERVFGSNSVVVVALLPKDGDIFDPDILTRAKRLSDGLLRIPGARPDTLMSLTARRAKAVSGNQDGIDIQPLMDAVPRSPQAMDALRRALDGNPLYRDAVVAGDGRAVAVSITLDKVDLGFSDGIEQVRALAAAARSPDVEVAVGGFPVYLAELEIYSQRMVLLFPLALLVVGLLHFEAFRTAQGFLLPLVTALLSVVWGLGVMGLAGVSMDAFNAVTPILILAVTAGHAVQLLKRYYEEFDAFCAAGLPAAEAGQRAVVASMVKVGPVMLAAGLVAAAGFFSLTTSAVETIRAFGIFTGIGILSGLVLELTLIPALRSWLPPPRHVGTAQNRPSPWDRPAALAATLALGRWRPGVYAAAAAIAVAAAFGIARLSLDNSTKSYFDDQLPFQQEDRLINDRLAGTNTFYVVFEGDADDVVKDPSVLRLIDDTQAFLASREGVGKTTSVADLVKRLNQAMHGDDPAALVIPESRELIAQYLLLYSMMGEPSDFDAYVDSRYRSALLSAYLKNDGSTYVNGLITQLNAFLAERPDPRLRVHLGGSVPETAALAQVLVEGKFENILQMGAVVFVVSALVFRSLIAGALVLAPLLVTVAVNYGTMGLTGMPLNTPNSISAALGVGIGADYAIYLLYRIREEMAVAKGDLPLAIGRAMATAGKAVLYVGSAIAGGYSVLMLSIGFNIHIWFGVLIVLSMAVSVAGALVLVPSLLLSFRPRFLAVLAVAALLGGGQARAEDATAAMERNYRVSRFDDSTGESTMTLIDKDGDRRVRQVLTVTALAANGIDNRRMVRFQSPADIRNTVVLMLEHADSEDEMMLYLPALKKIRRLAGLNKKDAFVGSDLSYGDVIGHRVADWTHRATGREEQGGEPCLVVESVPRDPAVAANSGYSKRVSWIGEGTGLARRTEFYDLDGVLSKLGYQSRPQEIDTARDRRQPMLTEMSNLRTGHRTILEFSRFVAGQGVDVDVFTARGMERPE